MRITNPLTKEQNSDGRLVAEILTEFTNPMDWNRRSKDFLRGFECQHRTLQQQTFQLILELIAHIAKDEYMVDGRNEYMKKIAQKLMKNLDRSEMEMPLI